MARSILGTVGLALTLAFAIPVAYLGVEFLLDGKTNQGLLFLGLAVLMVGIQEYVTTPMDLPGEIAGKVLGSAVKDPDESGDADDVGNGAEDARPETEGEDGEDGEDDGATEDEPLIPDAEGKNGG
jgi:hypothetical protein